MKKKSAMFSAAAVVSLSALLAGCSGGVGGTEGAAPVHRAPAAATAANQTLVQAIQKPFAANFLPGLPTTIYTQQVTSMNWDSLLTINAQDQLIPDLVSKWWHSKNLKTWYFQLSPKARWSNGMHVTSADVALDVEWLASQSYNGPAQGAYGYMVQPIVGAAKPLKDGTLPSGFKIINPEEFSITMTAPDAAVLPADLSGITPLPTFILGKIPMSKWNNSAYSENPTIGTGPYINTQEKLGQYVVGKANPYYVMGKPRIPYNEIKVVSSNLVAGALASGQVNISTVQPTDVAALSKDPNLAINVTPNNGFDYLGWKMDNKTYGKEFSNLKFRQAVEYAINRSAFIQAVYKGYATVQNGPLPAVNFWYNKALNGSYPYSTAKANALLNAAGFKIKNGWRTTPGGRPFKPTIVYPTNAPNRQHMAEFIGQELRAVGIDVQISPPLDVNTMYNDIMAKNSTIQGFMGGWSLSSDPDPRGLWRSTDFYNTSMIAWTKGAGVKLNDQLIHNQHTGAAFNQAYRVKVIHQWDALLNQMLPENFLVDNASLTGYSKNLHGVVFSPYGSLFIYKWYFSNK